MSGRLPDDRTAQRWHSRAPHRLPPPLDTPDQWTAWCIFIRCLYADLQVGQPPHGLIIQSRLLANLSRLHKAGAPHTLLPEMPKPTWHLFKLWMQNSRSIFSSRSLGDYFLATGYQIAPRCAMPYKETGSAYICKPICISIYLVT